MFINENGENIFQTLPGQGWQVLVDWNPDEQDAAEGHPRHTLEPVIAWVTAKIARQNDRRAWEDVIIAPLVRSAFPDELIILDARDDSGRKVAYLAPGETLTDEHFGQLKSESTYSKGVSPRG